jgi:hypothetical protein
MSTINDVMYAIEVAKDEKYKGSTQAPSFDRVIPELNPLTTEMTRTVVAHLVKNRWMPVKHADYPMYMQFIDWFNARQNKYGVYMAEYYTLDVYYRLVFYEMPYNEVSDSPSEKPEDNPEDSPYEIDL